ncbi:MAG: hypothetical protein OQK04_14660, partial [Kangiellaceae bacterium]|nr:hypothetical protein [Kangiellaceae bacterium]
MNYQISWNPQGTLIIFTGDIDINDIETLKDELHGDTRFYERAYSIVDFRLCDGSKIQTKDLVFTIGRTIGASITLKSFKIALVASKAHSRKLCQNFIDENKRAKSPWSFCLFNSIEEAKQWCEVTS